MGSGILKVAGTGRRRVKFHNISLYFGIDIRQRGKTAPERGRRREKKLREVGVKGSGGRRFRPPLSASTLQRKRLSFG